MIYELCYLVGESKSPLLEKIKSEVKNVITGEGVNLIDPEFLEKRKMAYKVKGEVRGTYIAQRFEIPKKDFEENAGSSEKNAILDISKKMKVYPDILRYIIVNTEDLPPIKGKEEIIQEKGYQPALARKKEVKKEKTKVANIDDKLEELLNI